MIQSLRAQYDLVICDTPPVLATADAAAIAAHADGVLLVVRAGQTQREAAREAIGRLNSVHAPVIGLILNDPDAVASRYGAYSYPKEYYTAQA